MLYSLWSASKSLAGLVARQFTNGQTGELSDGLTLRAKAWSGFPRDELDALRRIFTDLGPINDHITSGAIPRAPCLASPLPPMQLLYALEVSESEAIDFDRFVRVLAIFSPAAPWDAKMDVLYRMLDFDHDGGISLDDLVTALDCFLLRKYSGPQKKLEPKQAPTEGSSSPSDHKNVVSAQTELSLVQFCASETFKELGLDPTDPSSRIDRDQFGSGIAGVDVSKFLTIHFKDFVN